MFWRQTTLQKPPMDHHRAKRAIVQVGPNGRGFISGPNVITAASCLPCFPTPNPFGENKKHTYERLLGPLGGEPSVTADCCFADPVSNVAVLGGNLDEYENLIKWKWHYEKSAHYNALPIERPKEPSGPGYETDQYAWLLTLDGTWAKCFAQTRYDEMWIVTEAQKTFELDGRMSGSPIVNEEGAAIGIISAPLNQDENEDWVSIHPVLIRALPGWVLGLNAGAPPHRRFTGYRRDKEDRWPFS
jgi:hypothetical protein